MRTAILIAGTMISDAIRNDPNLGNFYSVETSWMITFLLILFIAADIYELLRKR